MHALVAPSGLHLTMECAASLLLQLMAKPVPESDEEAEGHAAHWHALQWAAGNRIQLGQKFKSGGREWEVDADMVNGSALYAYHTVAGGRFEDPVGIPQIHEKCYGTPDFWMLMLHYQTRAPESINVTDYKYGHRFVDAWENWQLIAYVIGVANRLGIADDNFPVVLKIVQPRCYVKGGRVREWRTTLGVIKAYAMKIHAQVLLALGANAPARVGAHCYDCKARAICVTLQRASYHIAEFVGVAEAVEMPPEALGSEARILLEAHELLTARLDGLKAQIEALMRGGTNVPHWTMKDGRSLWKWNEGVTVDDVRMLGMAAGAEIVNPPKPFTPTQARDAGVDEKILNAYATRQPPGRSLKPDDSNEVRKTFGAIRP